MNPQPPLPLWTLALAGTQCSVCWQPAAELIVYRGGRVVHHVAEYVRPCVVPNPPRKPEVKP